MLCSIIMFLNFQVLDMHLHNFQKGSMQQLLCPRVTDSILYPSRVKVFYATILQLSLCVRPCLLFPGILQRIIVFLNYVVDTTGSLNLFEVLICTTFMKCCLRRR